MFLNIIGTRYGFIKSELEENLDEIKELMDAPMTTSSTATSSTATSSTATSSTGPTAPTAPTAPTVRRNLSNRLRELIRQKSKPP